MRVLRAIWDFVVGDDWQVALGVVIALGATAVLASSGAAAWWVLPVCVAVLLWASVWRVAGRG
jgi:hypothetical protein